MRSPAVAAARRHLEAIGREPRPAGGDAEARARAHCAATLSAAGFTVREAPFSYSSAVGRWGMPAAGACWAVAAGIAAQLGSDGRPGAALLALVACPALLAAVAPRAASGGVARLPVARRRAVNLVATRGSATPALWLVAHVDSKSQPVPMVARVVGVGGSAIAWLLAVALALAQLAGAHVAALWWPIALIGIALALPVIGSVIGARSPGALDNASGVATVLLAVTAPLDAPPLPQAVGVLITSAEELGLAGARVWGRDAAEGGRVVAASRDRPVALNVDGVDDAGALRVMIASALPAALDAAIAAESTVERMRRPAGVLVDAIALADAGFAALTVSRGTVRTLARIHTPSDALDRLRGDGVVDAAALVRRLAAAVAS